MSQPDYVMALDLKRTGELSEEMSEYLDSYQQNFGFTPNVFEAYACDDRKLHTFVEFYHALMLEDSDLTELEREMIAVAVSSVNRCFYCLVTHGARFAICPAMPFLVSFWSSIIGSPSYQNVIVRCSTLRRK